LLYFSVKGVFFFTAKNAKEGKNRSTRGYLETACISFIFEAQEGIYHRHNFDLDV